MYQNLITFQTYSKKAMAFFAMVIALSAFLYGAFLLTAVSRTAERTKLESNIAELTSELGTYQAQYLVASQKVTPEVAAGLGFVKPSMSSIAYTNTAARALSLNNGLTRQ